jgi:hypothetical protein
LCFGLLQFNFMTGSWYRSAYVKVYDLAKASEVRQRGRANSFIEELFSRRDREYYVYFQQCEYFACFNLGIFIRYYDKYVVN